MRMPTTVFVNSSLSCPHFCPSIAHFAGICSFCLAAQNTAAIPKLGFGQRLPISVVAQLHLLNASLGGQQDVLRAFQLLAGQDWTTFLLAYLERSEQWPASPWSAPAQPMQHQPLQTVLQSQPLMPAQAVVVQPSPSNAR